MFFPLPCTLAELSVSLLRQRTAIAFAAAIAIAIRPTLLVLGRADWRRLRLGADAECSVVGVQGALALTISDGGARG